MVQSDGELEVIWQPLYDTVHYKHGRYLWRFFTEPLSDKKTLFETNMECTAQLCSPKAFLVEGFTIHGNADLLAHCVANFGVAGKSYQLIAPASRLLVTASHAYRMERRQVGYICEQPLLLTPAATFFFELTMYDPPRVPKHDIRVELDGFLYRPTV